MNDYGRSALSEVSTANRRRMIAQLGRMAADIDLDHDGPAARFFASIGALIRKADRDEFLRLSAFEDAINEPHGAIVSDGSGVIPDGWQPS